MTKGRFEALSSVFGVTVIRSFLSFVASNLLHHWSFKPMPDLTVPPFRGLIIAALAVSISYLGLSASSAAETVGVAFVPYMYGDRRADNAEQLLTTAAGEMKAIDYVFTPRNADDVFQTLLKLKRAGKKVGAIVLAGHAAENNQIILFGDGNGLKASDVDLPQLRKALSSAGKPQSDRIKERIRMLESVADVAVPNTQVLLLNCDAAKTSQGEKFVMNLGDVLVGRHGGRVTAPTSLLSLYTVDNYNRWFQHQVRTWVNSGFGDIIADASWRIFKITPRSQTTPRYIDLSGNWESKARPNDPWRPALITQNDQYLKFTNERGQTSSGEFQSPDRVKAIQWGNLGATVTNQGKQLRWDNGSVWRKAGSGTEAQSGNWAGLWLQVGGTVTITGTGNTVEATYEYRRPPSRAKGSWKSCRIQGNTATCRLTEEYEDEEKWVGRKGTVTATLNGDTISGAFYEDQEPSFRWKPGAVPWDSSIKKGKKYDFALTRKR